MDSSFEVSECRESGSRATASDNRGGCRRFALAALALDRQLDGEADAAEALGERVRLIYCYVSA